MFNDAFIKKIKELPPNESLTFTIIKRKQKDYLGFDIEFCEVIENKPDYPLHKDNQTLTHIME